MSQRTDQVSGEFDLGDGPDEDAAADDDSIRGRVKRRAGRFFSPRFFLVALVVTFVGSVVGNGVVPLPVLGGIGGLLGVFAAGFALGLATEDSRILESGAAGGTVAAVSTLLGNPLLAAVGIGLSLAVLGAGGGLIAGALGAYFGGDLRDGLTRDL